MNPTYEQLLAVFEAAAANGPVTPGDWEPPTPLVDWHHAYGSDDDPARWLAQPLLPAAGAVAIFARGGTGKSLLALWLAAGLATGTTLFGPVPLIDVLYLDYEMTVRDVVERLEDMGYDDPAALKALHYASLPTLAPLDSFEGGRAVVDMARHLGVRLVVVDTFGRAVDGEEDRADTVQAWYRWTGQLLKTAEIGFLRIDHAGKEIKRGQRGTSAKNDDVDVVWEMTARGRNEFVLRATKRRMSWVPDHVVLIQTDDNGVLGYRHGGGAGWLAGTAEVAAELDELDAPGDISRRKAMILLREAGHGRANNVVADALRFRREQGLEGGTGTITRGNVAPDLGPEASTNEKPLELHPEYLEVPGGGLTPPGGGVLRSSTPGGEAGLAPDPGVIG